MLTSGDVLEVDLGEPVGREAGSPRPVVVVTAQVVLSQSPSVVHVVPLTRTRRGFRSEIDIDPDERNGIAALSAAQCQHLRAVSTSRLTETVGNVGVATLAQLRRPSPISWTGDATSRAAYATTVMASLGGQQHRRLPRRATCRRSRSGVPRSRAAGGCGAPQRRVRMREPRLLDAELLIAAAEDATASGCCGYVSTIGPSTSTN